MKKLLTDIEIEDILGFIKPIKSIPEESSEAIFNLTKDRFRKLLVGQKVYPEIIPELKRQIEKNYRESLIQPGESIGIIAAQSIGEKQTQASVSYDEQIIIKKDNNIIKTSVGKFIDNELKNGNVVEFQKNNYIKIVKNIEVLTVSQEEKIEWKTVKEISKHPTNGDLMKIKTQSGREVVTTLSHSHLKKLNGSIEPILGSELKIGDRIPVIKKNYLVENNYSINISDFIKSIKIEDEYVRINNTVLKNKIELDEIFGWFLGAYLSEGNCTEYLTSITNINNEFENNINIFCDKYGLDYRTTQKFGTPPIMTKEYLSITHHIISSIVLSTFIRNICNTGSSDKKIPSFVYSSNKKFISSIIKGYIDGGGNISTGKNKEIRVDSINKNLLEEFGVLLSFFGIFTTINKQKINLYQLTIYGKEYITIYNNEIGSDLKDKKIALENILKTKDDFSSRLEMIPSDIGKHISKISSKLKLKGLSRYERLNSEIGRNTLGRFIKIFVDESKKQNINIDNDLKYCLLSYNSNIVWDKIIDIEIINEKNYNYEYVYDFSVKGNETFALFSGIVVHNTLNTLI